LELDLGEGSDLPAPQPPDLDRAARGIAARSLGLLGWALALPEKAVQSTLTGGFKVLGGHTLGQAWDAAKQSWQEERTVFSELKRAAERDMARLGIHPTLAKVASTAGALAGSIVTTAPAMGWATRGIGATARAIPVPQPVRKLVGQALIPRYGQPTAYQRMAEESLLDIAHTTNDVKTLVEEVTQGMTVADRTALTAAIKAGGVSADPKLAGAASTLRGLLDQIGQQAVEAGLIPADVYRAWQGEYIARLYALHEVKGKNLAPLMQWLGYQPNKATLTRFMKRQELPSWIYSDLQSALNGNWEEASSMIQGLAKNEEVPNWMRRAFNDMQRAADSTTIHPRIKAFVREHHLPDDIRQQMGEILDASYLTSKGASETLKDIRRVELFNQVSKQKDWVSDVPAPGFSLMADTPKLGILSGQYVKAEIADDINRMEHVAGPLVQGYRKMLGQWKAFKTIWNPATQSRNVLSNIILADVGGLSPARIDIYQNALSELRSQGRFFQLFNKEGLYGKGFAASELRGYLDDLLKERDAGGLWSSLVNGAGQFQDRLGKVYQFNEEFFKTAKALHNLERGMDVKAAVDDAQTWLFDYSKTTPFINLVKDTAIPFVTFTYKALPAIAKAAAEHPVRLWKYPIALADMTEAAAEELDLSEKEWERARALLPGYVRRGEFLLLPFKDQSGRLQFVDFTYIFPWGDIGEIGQQGLGRLMQNPLVTLEEDLRRGRAAFNDQELWNHDDNTVTAKDKFLAGFRHAFRTLMPALMPPYGTSVDVMAKAIEGVPDWAGRQSSLPQAVLRTLAGIKVTPVDLSQQQRQAQADLRGDLQQLHDQQRKVSQDRSLSAVERLDALDELNKKMAARRKMGLLHE